MTRAEEHVVNTVPVTVAIDDPRLAFLYVRYGTAHEYVEVAAIPSDVQAYCEWLEKVGLRLGQSSCRAFIPAL